MKWVVGLIVVVAVGVGLLWWSGAQAPISPVSTNTTEQDTNQPSAPSDTSDAGIEQDAKAIDVQMQAFASDSASIDSSADDKPVEQSY